MVNWYINPLYPDRVRKIFGNIEQVLALDLGAPISISSISRVCRYSIGPRTFYIKHYFSKGKGLKKYFGRSRWRSEYENLLFCQKLNIKVPMLVAYGKKYKRCGSPFNGVIITEEVKDATDLKNMALHFQNIFSQKTWRHYVIKTIAHNVALLHKKKFLHYDLQWRNILVTKSIHSPCVYFFDMPSGRVRSWFFSFAIKRDFYNLYKSAVLFLSRTEQLRFYLWYQSVKFLTKKHKKQIKKIIAYYQHKEYKDLRNQ